MKTFIIAAITADGFIGKSDGESSLNWTSKEDRDFFVERTKKAGVVIMGSKTYQTIKKPLKGRLNIIYSKTKQYDGVEVTQKEPKKLLNNLQKRGFSEAVICGGSTIYTLFMKAGVVDEIYLTVEPLFFGSGIRLFNEKVDFNLSLNYCWKLNKKGTILLNYKVV